MRKTLKKGSKEAKAFMAKLRAKKASATKSVKTVATNVKRIAKGAKKAFRDGYYAKDKVCGANRKKIGSISDKLKSLYNNIYNRSKSLNDGMYSYVVSTGGEPISISSYKELTPYSAQVIGDNEFNVTFYNSINRTMVIFTTNVNKTVIDKDSYNKYGGNINIYEPITNKIATEIMKKVPKLNETNKVGATGKTRFIFSVYKRDEFGDAIPSSKKTMIVTRVKESSALEVVYRKYPYRNYWASLSDAEYIGSTLLIEKGENPRKRPTRVIQVNRTKKGLFKKFSKVSGVNHKDTKSHNVNIRVVSGVVNIMDVKRDLDKSILLLEGAKMATIDKNNTNYLTQNKPLVFKNITEKKSFIKQYTKQVKILKDLYRNTLKNKLNK
jgi:hypothetical protein